MEFLTLKHTTSYANYPPWEVKFAQGFATFGVRAYFPKGSKAFWPNITILCITFGALHKASFSSIHFKYQKNDLNLTLQQSLLMDPRWLGVTSQHSYPRPVHSAGIVYRHCNKPINVLGVFTVYIYMHSQTSK